VSDTAVLVIDMLNTYRHPDAEQLAANVADIIDALVELVGLGRNRQDADLIYVNDNYGDFTADFQALVRAAVTGERPDLVEPVVPVSGDHILTKVRHSVFYATSLDYLLGRLNTRRIVLAGQVTEQCILYSALDGYIRHFDVIVPPDAVAHIDADLGAAALKMMQRNMRAELLPAASCLS
jgi:nicotinamidase-related amidase